MKAKSGLLMLVFNRDKPHAGSGHCLTDRGRICGIVLAALTRHSIGRNEFRSHQLDRMAVLGEHPRPMMSA
ncbi:hypothetical protein ALQ72_200024 [Pseudomonas syringae pv. maculicola]|nr:hypothetical protein ALQ72_200024 [Pseudomonas syringae pv. maculicola]